MSQDPDFKSIRQSKGLTIEDIARRTKIRSGFLEAIEEGNYHLLPEKYYVETFIKVYAETLGVDSAPFLAHGRTSTLIATQIPVTAWHARIPDPTLANAILDRHVHQAHRPEPKGESVRKTRAPLS